MRTRIYLGGILAVAVLAGVIAAGFPAEPVHAASIEVLVTSAANDLEDPACPNETRCTLRQAIETVNESPLMPGDNFVIRFDTEIFAADEPAEILLESPLPVLTRTVAVIDGSDAGVIIDGSNIPEGDESIAGIRVNANNAKVRGLSVRNFRDVCVEVAGEDTDIGGLRSLGQSVRVDGCRAGIVAAGPGAVVSGNEVGLGSAGTPLEFGIVIEGSVTVGGEIADRTNFIANADRAIVAGAAPAANVTIRNNVAGEGPTGQRGIVRVGVTLYAPVTGADVRQNRIAGAEVGIAVPFGEGGFESTGNSFLANTFIDIGTIAIDLGETGSRNPNDPGDSDAGPNNLQNHPEFERAVQAEVTGVVPGPCANCTVELYFAEHRPGSDDVPTSPVPSGTTTTNALGEFVFVNPQVSPGDWLMATATDSEGNTSEFGPSVRVGTGILQCGNVPLLPGWNNAGYFGAVAPLGSVFPPGSSPPGPVVSIHRLAEGTRDYRTWFRGASELSDLNTILPGEAYWYYAEAAATVPGSFTLGVPVPVQLSEGWNNFVYIGAPESIATAFESIQGKYVSIYRYNNNGGTGSWSLFAAGDVPDWVQGFTSVEPCTAYFIHMTEEATLIPPQP